jgi:sec-independent protein translocase protein TatC
MTDKAQPIVEHLQELRSRIVYSLIALLIAVIGAFAFSGKALSYILATAKTDTNIILVQNTFADAFLTQFRLALIGGLIMALPFVLYQLVAFIVPALKPAERRILFVGLPFATLLFMVGWAFGWFVVVPITKSFFLGVSSGFSIQNQITPSNYLSFVLSICNPLGIAFELPLVVLILARIGLVTATFLSRVRKYAFLILLVLAAVLSPPDIISMGIFMVPLYGLYEFSILLARFAAPKR